MSTWTDAMHHYTCKSEFIKFKLAFGANKVNLMLPAEIL